MTRRASRIAILGAAVVSFAAVAAAQPNKPAAKPAPSASASAVPTPLPAKQGALVHVAAEIAQAIGQVPANTLVVSSPLASDIPAPKGEELAVKIATHVAGRLGSAKAHPQPATLAVARGLSGRAASLVFVQLEIAKGELRATADLYTVVSNGRERLRNPAPGPRAHAFAGAPLDAEVRTFLTPILLEQASVHKVKHEETDVVAVGCGDVDLDGGNELVILSRTRVTLAKIRGGKLSVMKAVPWSQVASRAAVPLREPLASVVVSPRSHRGEILLGSTDRASVSVDASLVTKRVLTGLPIPGGEGNACAVVVPEAGAFDGSGVSCSVPLKGEPAKVLEAPIAKYDAIAALDLVAKDGSVAKVVAAREPSGKLRLHRPDGPGKPIEALLENAGAQLALADLDLDGTPEIITTTEKDDDVLIVTSWNGKSFAPRLRVPAKEGVRAVTTCPPEEKGLPAVVAVVGSEVWLVR